MFAVGGLLSIIQAGGVLLMPPSPRFYVLHGKYTEVGRFNIFIHHQRRLKFKKMKIQ